MPEETVIPQLRSHGLLAAALLNFAAPAAAALDFTPIKQRLDRDCAAGKFSGEVLVRVEEREQFYFACGVADVATGKRINRSHRFRIFSTSKLLTALAIMRLVEHHKIALDAPITRYLAEAPKTWSNVTVHQLLQHTSGLPDQTEALLDVFRKSHALSHAMAMRVLLKTDRTHGTKPVTKPGSEWKYNNFGYELLAQAGSEVMRQPFDQVLRQQVFRPARMRSATVETPLVTKGDLKSKPDLLLVRGYNGSPGKLEEAHPLSFVQLGAGAVHASVDDFAALADALSAGRVVSPTTFHKMTGDLRARSKEEQAERGYGLGFLVRGTNGLRYVGHDGGINGYLSDFELYPESSAMLIVLTNLGFADSDWIRVEVGKLLQSKSASPPPSA